MDILWGTAALWATDSGQDGFKDFLSQEEQCSESSDTGPSDSVASAVSDTLDQFFAAELAQVVGSFGRMVFGHGSAVLASHHSKTANPLATEASKQAAHSTAEFFRLIRARVSRKGAVSYSQDPKP